MNTIQFNQAATSARIALNEQAIKSLKLNPYISDFVDTESKSVEKHLNWVLDADGDHDETLSRCHIFLSIFSRLYRDEDQTSIERRNELLSGFHEILLYEYNRSRLVR